MKNDLSTRRVDLIGRLFNMEATGKVAPQGTFMAAFTQERYRSQGTRRNVKNR